MSTQSLMEGKNVSGKDAPAKEQMSSDLEVEIPTKQITYERSQ